MINKNFNYYIALFFSEYLPNVIGVSKNTIQSYSNTFIIFIEYIEKNYNYNINNLEITTIDYTMVENFLMYLENERKNSVSTRNQRLAVISSFYKFVQKRELSCFELCSKIISIPTKKTVDKTIAYFSLFEIEILLKQPNTTLKLEFRDYIILLLMYETACRAQELCDLKKRQISLTNNNIILIGKGNKERRVPITKDLTKLLEQYYKIFEISNEEDYIFYNRSNQKLTTKGIEYILLKYIQLAKEEQSDLFREHYSNHSMRHTRAMHLLEAGVNLVYIRDILRTFFSYYYRNICKNQCKN